MLKLRIVVSRVLGLLGRRRRDADLSDEIQAHLDLIAEEHVRRGMSSGAARAAARREFGGMDQTKETYRDQRGLPFADRLAQDVRYALRTLRNSRGFTSVAVATLAIGIGANTGVFTLLYALAFRPLPVKDADRVVNIFVTFGGEFSRGVSGNVHLASYPEYLAYRDRSHVFEGLAAYAEAGAAGGAAGTVRTLLVSCNYLQVLKAETALGRTFLTDDCRAPGEVPVAVLSYAFWQRHFHGDPGVLGATLALNRSPFTIVGVAEREFVGTDLQAPDVWVPVTLQPLLRPRSPETLAANVSWLTLVGRLQEGVTIQESRADLSVVAAQIDAEYPGRRTTVTVDRGTYLNGPEVKRRGAFVVIGILSVVGLVLLMACCNVMNLLLARAVARRHEVGVRLAMGAGRGRLVQQLVTESAVLALAGGAVGFVLAWWLPPLLLAMVQPGLRIDLTPDLRVFGYTFGLSLASALLFGLVPALASTDVHVSAFLKKEPLAYGRRRRSKLQDVLVVVQVAGCLLLLIVGGLLVRGVRHAQTLDPGFVTKDVLAISLNLSRQGYDPARAAAFYRDLRSRIAAVAGTDAVSMAAVLPLQSRTSISIDPDIGGIGEAARDMPVGVNVVSADYFRTLQIPIVRGRTDVDDSGRAEIAPVVVSAAMARWLWRDRDPLGQRFRAQSKTYEVVGVAEDVHNYDLTAVDGPFFYSLGAVDSLMDATLLVHAPDRVPAVAAAVPGLVRGLDQDVMATLVRFEDRIADQLAPSVAIAVLCTLLGSFALLLALVGVYGVVNYGVKQRTHEIGVRLALGAVPRDVTALVVRQGMRPVLVGLVAGAFLAAAASQTIVGLLFGVSSLDPLAYIVTMVLVSGAAAAATYVPARRAASADPLVALRHE